MNGVALGTGLTINGYTGNTVQTGDSYARIGATGSGLTSLATPTNITAGTITTVTNLTNAPTSGDLTATMKTSVTTAVNAATTVGITSNRKKGATSTFEFIMTDSTTGAPKTGLTVTSKVSKDGGAAANTANSVTEIGLGQYQIVLTNTEMTANNILFQCTATGAVTYSQAVQTQP